MHIGTCACTQLYGPAPMTREDVRRMMEQQDKARASRSQKPAEAETASEGNPRPVVAELSEGAHGE